MVKLTSHMLNYHNLKGSKPPLENSENRMSLQDSSRIGRRQQPSQYQLSQKAADKIPAPQEAQENEPVDDVQIQQANAPQESAAKPTADHLLSITLKIPFAAIGGAFNAVPVLLKENEAKDPNWSPKPGEPLIQAPVLDVQVTLDAPKDKRPMALSVRDLDRRKLPPDISQQPCLISQFGKSRPGQNWREAVQSAIRSQKSNPEGEAYINLTVGVNDAELQALGDQAVGFAPFERINVNNHTWQDGQAPIVRPEFIGANFINDAQPPGTIPQVEYLLVDKKRAEADFPSALEEARSKRPIHKARVKSNWGGRDVIFDVQVTDRFQRALENSPNTSFDPQTGKLTTKAADNSTTTQDLTLSTQVRKGTGQDVPNWLLPAPSEEGVAMPLGRVVVDFDPATSDTSISCPDGYSFRGAEKIQAAKTYKALVPSRKGPREIDVRFSDLAAAQFSMGGLTFAKQDAVVYTPDGQKIPLDNRTHGKVSEKTEFLRAMAGMRPTLTSQSPAWTFEHYATPSQALYAFPEHGLEIGIGNDGTPMIRRLDSDGQVIDKAQDDFRGLQTLHRIKRHQRERKMDEVLSAARSFDGNPELSVPLSKWKVNDKVTINAPNEQSAKQVESLAKLFLGAGRENFEIDPGKVQAFKDRVQVNDLDNLTPTEAMNLAQERLSKEENRREMAELLGRDWQGQEAEELAGDIKSAISRTSPVEITIVPRGADLQPYLGEKEKALSKSSRLEMAAFILKPKVQFLEKVEDMGATKIFVAEELLDTPESKVALAHELLHGFEEIYASDDELDTIASCYEKANKDEREFPCHYGALKSEFLTTMGEEFLSLHGEDGPQWVKSEHPEMYKLLSGLTGLDPLRNGKASL